jgi:AbrB family looped-hinge helix DNA binding protein
MVDRPVLLEFLATTKIGEKGQLTVPKEFREDLGLGAGAPFCVLRMGDGLLLLPEQQRFDRLCAQIAAALTGAGITPEALLATLPATRKRIFEQRYGKGASAASRSPKESKRDRER